MASGTVLSSLFRSREISQLYHVCRPRYDDTKIMEKVVQFISKHLQPPFSKAVDVGCGTGLSTRILASHFKSVVGIDPSPSQIEEAKSSNEAENIEFCIGKAEDLSMIADSSLELLTAGTAIHYFDCEVFFKEVNRVLKPGGCFAQFGYTNDYIEPRNLDFNGIDHPSRDEVLKKCNELTIEIFQTILKQDGYEPCLATDNNGVSPPYGEVERHILSLHHPCNVTSLLEYFKSLGMWQSYCVEKGVDSEKLLDQFKQRFHAFLREIADDPEKMPLTFRMDVYLILARKPVL